MGLTVQNLGVEAPRLLGVAPEKRDDPARGRGRDIEGLRHWLPQPETGIELGAWHEIPPDIRRSLSATVGSALVTFR